MRGSGHETSCNLTMRVTYFVLEQGQHSYSCSLVPRPTSSFDCLQCVKQNMASYPGPGYNSPIPNTLPPPPPPQYLPMQKYWCNVLIQTISGHVQGIFIQNQLLTKYGTPKILGAAIGKTGGRERTGMPRNENQQHLNDCNS